MAQHTYGTGCEFHLLKRRIQGVFAQKEPAGQHKSAVPLVLFAVINTELPTPFFIALNPAIATLPTEQSITLYSMHNMTNFIA